MYDPNGNLTSKNEGTDSWIYEWNARNELTRVLKNSLEQARFAYDPLGRRVEKVADGVTTSYAYDVDDVLREVRGAATQTYVHSLGIDEPFAVERNATLSFFHADGLGSIVKETDGVGAVTAARQYDAWGNLEVGKNSSGYAFAGREWEPEAGLYYYRARYYDPVVGRFVSEDPIGYDDGPNVFAYVHNGPPNATDPFGLDDPRCDGVPDPKETPCRLECCAIHDECYDRPNDPCTQTSWQWVLGGAAPPGQERCVSCDRDVLKCWAKCTVVPPGYDDPNRDNCYSAKTKKWGPCPPAATPPPRTPPPPKRPKAPRPPAPTPCPRPAPPPPTRGH